jgi:hypothetical protein
MMVAPDRAAKSGGRLTFQEIGQILAAGVAFVDQLLGRVVNLLGSQVSPSDQTSRLRRCAAFIPARVCLAQGKEGDGLAR